MSRRWAWLTFLTTTPSIPASAPAVADHDEFAVENSACRHLRQEPIDDVREVPAERPLPPRLEVYPF
jgi:hypothetical protein